MSEKREIWIDGARFLVDRRVLPVADLKQMATPPVPSDRDLYVEPFTPGAESFMLPRGQEVVDLDQGVKFFSAPPNIGAG